MYMIFPLLLLLIFNIPFPINSSNNLSMEFDEKKEKNVEVSIDNKNILIEYEEKESSIKCLKFYSAFFKYFHRILKPNFNRENKNSIGSLPAPVTMHIAKFLTSPEILRLSNTCKRFKKIFNVLYWEKYLSQSPKFYSSLLGRKINPSSHRRDFFSHLWYSEGLIGIAAKIGHPEALALQQYKSYGLTILKNQYLCCSGKIRYISGEVDVKRTELLKHAINEKTKLDLKIFYTKEKIKTQRENSKIFEESYEISEF